MKWKKKTGTNAYAAENTIRNRMPAMAGGGEKCPQVVDSITAVPTEPK